MRSTFGKLSAILVVLSLAVAAARTDDSAVPTPFNGKNLDGWKCKGRQDHAYWKVGTAKLDPADPGKLAVTPAPDGKGEMVNLIGHGGSDIYSEGKYGDCTIDLEIMVPRGSNSGVYVMGEYEIQVLDSFGRANVGAGDMGGIYGAAAPKANASKAPGQWQRMVIEVRTPRFEGQKKVANARFLKVTLNGQVIHENVELKGVTPGGVAGKEAPTGPLMFQGNHGPVAYRNIKITPVAK
jgi:hypothetical protein